MTGLNNEFIIVKTTYPSLDKAKELAEILLQNRLAACVQFCEIESLYSWRGKIENDHEILVSIKSKKSLFEKIEKIIKKHHEYKVPQIISIRIDEGLDDYLTWINCETEKN